MALCINKVSDVVIKSQKKSITCMLFKRAKCHKLLFIYSAATLYGKGKIAFARIAERMTLLVYERQYFKHREKNLCAKQRHSSAQSYQSLRCALYGKPRTRIAIMPTEKL